MRKKQLLIVDDSAFMRKLITDFFTGHPEIEVAGTAKNGREAIRKTTEIQPDIITMDVEMPVMDGVQAVREIMASCPVPIVMLSSTTTAGAEQTVAAMEAGAADFVAKPGGSISLDLHLIRDELAQKLLLASRISLKKERYRSVRKPASLRTGDRNRTGLILIGASTGGPRALQEVISHLPADLPYPVCVVQHMPPKFTKSLAERLNSLSGLTVKEAENGELIKRGCVYIAPGGTQMRIFRSAADCVLSVAEEPAIPGVLRPSVDVLFESVAETAESPVTAVILTGMGADGTEGLGKLKNTGADVHVIAEAEETCIVYGMPKAAAESGRVDEVVPLEEIAHAIVNSLIKRGA
ncbi:protein-glutamate methylesterase/protein-glutamine glutaminase [Indiicoccus explosivorum]|uniref:protein-glutamate methylesterase/protein-glutamine glutaminase n=1 Tax=Indiicoccus explosivorum TaxID=1917864 RepID=UPI000B43242B|nr:chemotaxis response regulator protein-glutamate methylesterase [Indiicoccus explosivorum]